MNFPSPKELHAYRNPDGSYTLIVKNEAYQRFGGPKGKYAGELETTFSRCRFSMKVICESGEHEIGGKHENRNKSADA